MPLDRVVKRQANRGRPRKNAEKMPKESLKKSGILTCNIENDFKGEASGGTVISSRVESLRPRRSQPFYGSLPKKGPSTTVAKMQIKRGRREKVRKLEVVSLNDIENVPLNIKADAKEEVIETCEAIVSSRIQSLRPRNSLRFYGKLPKEVALTTVAKVELKRGRGRPRVSPKLELGAFPIDFISGPVKIEADVKEEIVETSGVVASTRIETLRPRHSEPFFGRLPKVEPSTTVEKVQLERGSPMKVLKLELETSPTETSNLPVKIEVVIKEEITDASEVAAFPHIESPLPRHSQLYFGILPKEEDTSTTVTELLPRKVLKLELEASSTASNPSVKIEADANEEIRETSEDVASQMIGCFPKKLRLGERGGFMEGNQELEPVLKKKAMFLLKSKAQPFKTRYSRKKITCVHCGKRFPNLLLRTYHLQKDHPKERPHQCKVCGWRFTTHEDLSQHFVQHEIVRFQSPLL